ncbi:MAG TPA: serine/threonine-protein kinase [Gemmataceae bacterium]
MPSDSIVGFLDRARASRVLFPEQIDQLFRQPDLPHANLDSLCQYLEERGALTRFQAEAIRSGRGDDLNFASYPVVEEIGPCPGGTAYRALHPSLRTPIELRRFKAELLFPADTPGALLQRAQAAAALHHPYLVTLLDAGMAGDEPYAAIEVPVDSVPLDVLVHDIGPMPSFLAAEYGRQSATALRAAHERGLWHGDLRPASILIGPMTAKPGADEIMKRRPAPNAAVKVAELGLVPKRPAAVLSPPPVESLPYLPPERLESAAYEPRGDLYSLGATLYHLLTGRPPFAAATPTELIQKVRSTEPPPLAALRPDVPMAFSQLVHQLLKKQPTDRPGTAQEVEQALAAFCRPGSAAPLTAVPMATAPVMAVPVEEDVPTAEAQPSSADDWGASTDFHSAHAEAAAKPVAKRQLSAKDKARTKLLVILGLCLHISAVALVVAYFAGAFNSSPDPEPAPTKHKEPAKKKPRTRP